MLKIYNTLSNTKEEFKSINSGKVSMYTCGPTVYDYIHIGNLRSYITADLLNRWLTRLGYEVRSIKNITDVGHLTNDDLFQGDSGEDKMIKKAKKEKKTPLEIAKFYENAAKESEDAINIKTVSFMPRATEHVSYMIKMIEKIILNGFAYEKNGNVFFEVDKMKSYGVLSGNTLENLDIGSRLHIPHPDKKNQWDFALWLKAPKNHIMKWNSPWSLGYPGWHIGCSAMSLEYLGNTIDIHTGGEDNIFPHHEAEIAQSECATGEKFVNYWIHTRFLLVNGKKMSKSKGNFYTLSDIIKKGYAASDLRMLYLMSHYRSQMNFTFSSLTQAKKNKERLVNTIIRLKESVNNEVDVKLTFDKFKNDFVNAMNDDLNTPKAISVLLKLSTKINKTLDKYTILNSEEILCFLNNSIQKVLGIKIEVESVIKIPEKVMKIFKKRQISRENKDFQLSDKLRYELKNLGYIVKDTPTGQKLTRI